MAFDDDQDREMYALKELGEMFNVSPEDLIEGRVEIEFELLPRDLAEAAELCPCPICGRPVACSRKSRHC
jgi:hypothetical protein